MYLLAPGHDAAKKRILDLLTASPQDMTHADYALPTQPALPRLREIRIPTLILVGDADIPTFMPTQAPSKRASLAQNA